MIPSGLLQPVLTASLRLAGAMAAPREPKLAGSAQIASELRSSHHDGQLVQMKISVGLPRHKLSCTAFRTWPWGCMTQAAKTRPQ